MQCGQLTHKQKHFGCRLYCP